MDYIKSYINESKSPLYSLIIVLPIIIIYEILIFSMNKSDIIGIRNGADVLFRQFFALFGIFGFYFVGFVIMVVLIFIFAFNKSRKIQFSINFQFILLMLMESIIYAYILRVVMDKMLMISLMDVDSLSKKEMFAMCLGAGIYEEFIFRFMIMQAVFLVSKQVFKMRKATAIAMGILISALIFSGFHYIGEFGDQIQLLTFLFRFFAGMILSVIFLLRGYGIAVYTHTIYDLLLFI